ncbi:hypothetical protein [Hydrogenophaga sp.]|uniref:hypothetical protein n=1 Tax=Hydrogenophaga sp. TaxID=1904254 RepID=UPI002731820F|nr:hypothetical protein [Hydrogenophaga sp.]MDP2018127.1 hypothetical protein [Hydrogenophaga sp.]MDP3164711.1 hypothetical protein [Hydrogenophaga sp.]
MSGSIRRLSFLALLVAALAGCGGRGGPDALPSVATTTPDTPTNPAPFAWLDAERLDLGDSGSAHNTRLALNRQGAGMVVWEHVDGSTVEVHARTVSINDGLGATLALGTGIAAFPDVAIDEQGHALAVWVQGATTLSQIWARSYDPDTGWGTAQMMSRPQDTLVAQPRAAINEAGEMAVVWMQTVGVTYQVHARRFSPTQGWSSAVRLDSAPYEAWTPQVSLDAEGRLLCVWYQSDADGRSNLWANHIDPDGTSATAVQIDQSDGYSNQPVLARLGDGSSLAMWRQTNEVLLQVIGLNRFQPGSGWATTTSASGGYASVARSPYLAAWGASNAVTAWVQSTGSRTEVWANRIQQGQPGQPQALQGGQTLAQDDARIGADDLGHAIGMWTVRDGAARTLWTTQWPASGAPGTAQRLDNSESSSVSESALGVNARGQALAVWIHTEGDRARLWARPYRAP